MEYNLQGLPQEQHWIYVKILGFFSIKRDKQIQFYKHINIKQKSKLERFKFYSNFRGIFSLLHPLIIQYIDSCYIHSALNPFNLNYIISFLNGGKDLKREPIW